ncbi:uncharacterized protein LOC134254609 [Saccostrea cucullata]|uniref:uncharacterized protein LOC134254609 n=1 Tax=Saccostrea cuccullata TaxID=36930 RepID=UPI002ED69911
MESTNNNYSRESLVDYSPVAREILEVIKRQKSVTPSSYTPMSARSVASDRIFHRGSAFGCSPTPGEQSGKVFTYVPTPPLTPNSQDTRPCSNLSRKLGYSPPPTHYTSHNEEFVDVSISMERGLTYKSYSSTKHHRESEKHGSSFSSSSFYENQYQQAYTAEKPQRLKASSSGRIFSPNLGLEIVGSRIPVSPAAETNATGKRHHKLTQSLQVEHRFEIQENYPPSYSGTPTTVDQVFHIKEPPEGQNNADVLRVKQQKSMQLMNEERQRMLESRSEKFSGHKAKEKKSKKKSKAEKRSLKGLTDLPPILDQRKKPYFPEGKKQRRVKPVPKVSKKDEEFLKKMELQMGYKNKLPSISPENTRM